MKRSLKETSLANNKREKATCAKSSLLENHQQSCLPTHLRNIYFHDNNRQLLELDAPKGYSLSQAICSYGYFCLPPNRWVPSPDEDDERGYLVRPISLNEKVTTQVAIGQWGQERILVSFDKEIKDETFREELVHQVKRMLRLEMDLSDFHSMHSEAKKRGFGRIYRSPTLFEDIIKTITNCNMKWSGTVDMNAKLCRQLGRKGSFPLPSDIQKSTPDFLKQNCRLGYRSVWIWQIAKDVCDGNLDLQRLQEFESSDDLARELKSITGVGKFASNNILHLMGFFDSHPYDTETIRLMKEEFGVTATTKELLFKKAKVKYDCYAPYQFIAYWFDLWKNYEKRAGAKSPQWSIEQNESERPNHILEDHNQVFQNNPRKKKKEGVKK